MKKFQNHTEIYTDTLKSEGVGIAVASKIATLIGKKCTTAVLFFLRKLLPLKSNTTYFTEEQNFIILNYFLSTLTGLRNRINLKHIQ